MVFLRGSESFCASDLATAGPFAGAEAVGDLGGGAETGWVSGGGAAAAASFAALICSFLSSLSLSNFACCSWATFCRSSPDPPTLVVFLDDFFPFCASLSAELEKKKKKDFQ